MSYFFFSPDAITRRHSDRIPDKSFHELIKEVEDYEEKCALGHWHLPIYMGKYSLLEEDRIIVYRVVYTENEHVVWSFSCKPGCFSDEEVEKFKTATPGGYSLAWKLEKKWGQIWDNVSTKTFDELKEDFARVCEVKEVPRGVLRLLQPTIKLTNGAELTVIRIVHD